MTTLISLEEAAKQLDLDIQTVRRLCFKGELEACKFGNRYKTKQEWIEAYIKKQKVQVKK